MAEFGKGRGEGMLREIAERGKPEIERTPRSGALPAELFEVNPKGGFIVRDGKQFAGSHLIVDFFRAEYPEDAKRIKAGLIDATKASSATLLHIHLHRFSDFDGGISGVAVLAESHISIHTWPRYGYAAVDIFMCGGCDPYLAIPVLKDALAAREVRIQEFLRGEVYATDTQANLLRPAEEHRNETRKT